MSWEAELIGNKMRIDNSWLKKRRDELGLSQADLVSRLAAAGAEVNRVTVSKWELNKQPVQLLTTVDGTKMLAQALGLSSTDLLLTIYGDELEIEFDAKRISADVLQILERIIGYNTAQRAAVWAMLDIVDAIPDVDASKLKPGRILLSDSEPDVE